MDNEIGYGNRNKNLRVHDDVDVRKYVSRQALHVASGQVLHPVPEHAKSNVNLVITTILNIY